MKTNLKSTLEAAIQEWLENEAYEDSRPDCVMLHDELSAQMAEAAAAVFDSCVSAQVYNENKREEV